VTDDPVDARRAAVTRWVTLGKRVGYSCFGAAMVLFIVGLATTFASWIATTITALLVVGCVVLPPAIVFGYGLRAAIRDEQGGKPFH
jgi:hypothetical protein